MINEGRTMAKAKKDSIFSNTIYIFFQGIKLYFLNFEKFFKYLAFPIFGQILGIALIFFASYIFTLHVSTLTTKSPIFDNIPIVFLMLMLCALPGFFIFCKAFWDYLIALASLNSMASTLLEGGELDDTGMHAELIKRRTSSYIWFLILLSLIYCVLSFPILWGLLIIAFVYLALAFQVFALEDDKNAFECIKLAIGYVRFNFKRTALLLLLLGITTYWLAPGLISWGFEKSDLIGFFSYPVEQYIRLLPLQDINDLLTQIHIPIQLKSYEIAKQIVLFIVAFAVTGFSLPLRSICCTALYKDINKRNYAGKIAAEKLAQRAQMGSKKLKRKSKDEDDEE